MFASDKTYTSFQSAYLNKPVPLYTHSGSNKENYNPFSLKKSQNHPCSGPEPQSNQNRPLNVQPLADIKYHEPGQASHSHYGTTLGLEMSSKKSSGSKDSSVGCRHESIRRYKRAYCKDCGTFLAQNGAETYKEESYKHKIDIHPDEVYKLMVENQGKNREYIQGSAHVNERKILVDWMCELGDELQFFSDTIYTAISYLDTILPKVQIPKSKLQLICLCCLIIAAKFNENDEKVPSYRDLSEFCHGSYSVDLFKRSETFVLEMLDWNLKTVTPHQFVQFFLSKGCAFSTDASIIRDIDSKLLRYLRKYSEFFTDISLQNYDFNAYQANVLACSAICGARKAVGLHPIWNCELEELTEVSWDEIEPCFNMLYSSFEVAFPEVASKANSYANKIQRKGSVRDLEQSYAAMTIKTPYKEQNWRDERSDYSSSQKEKAPEGSEDMGRRRVIDWSIKKKKKDRDEEKPMKNAGIKMFKRGDEGGMNIENMCEELMRRDTESAVKRNLVF